jgi:hypothetical protein
MALSQLLSRVPETNMAGSGHTDSIPTDSEPSTSGIEAHSIAAALTCSVNEAVREGS